MRNAILVAVFFVLFIVMVEWQRRTSRVLPKAFDTKVSAASSRREAPRRPSGGKSGKKDEAEAAGEALPIVVGGDAGAPAEEKPGAAKPPEEPEDPAVARKKAEAVMDAIQRLIDAERRDDPWATTTETWVTDTYGSSPGSRVERVECKKTMCTVLAVHDSEPRYRGWLARFSADADGKHLRAMTMPGEAGDGKTHTRSFLFKEP